MPELLTKDEPAATEAPEDELHTWAREHVSAKKWTQITKYFPGYRLRRQMV